MPSYANPFDPNPLPGAPGLHDYYLNSTPDAAFWEYLGRQGLGGVRPVDKFAQSQQNRTYNQYQAYIADDPNLGFWDYLNRQHPDFSGEYGNQSPSQRGDTSNRFLQPRARFVNAY